MKTSRGRLRPSSISVPPVGLVLVGILTVQFGSAMARGVFDQVGPGGAAFLRVGVAAVVLTAVWRPTFRGHSFGDFLAAILFGLVTAGMNLSFYLAIQRIPLGIAVTLEFVGPLGVAVAGSRQWVDGVWVALAGLGIVLLAPWGGANLDYGGMAWALLAGAQWAAYILLSARVGRIFPGGRGLAVAMIAGGLALLPVGIASGGVHLLRPSLIFTGVAIALLSSVVPYSLELEALRSLSTRVFGVLMSLEPGVAAVVGLITLGQVLPVRAIVALVAVSIASLGASRTGSPPLLD